MDLLTALQRSYAEGLGCRPVGCDLGIVRWVERRGQTYLIRTYSPATRRAVDFVEDGGPALLSEWLRPHEVCRLPPDVEPEVRPAQLSRLSDLLRE